MDKKHTLDESLCEETARPASTSPKVKSDSADRCQCLGRLSDAGEGPRTARQLDSRASQQQKHRA